MRSNPIRDSAQYCSPHCSPRDDHFRAFYLFPTLRGIADIGKKDAPSLLDQQESSAAGKAAKISDIGEMTDQESIEPSRGQMLPQFFLAKQEIHRCRV
jgi:hypothetical protein